MSSNTNEHSTELAADHTPDAIRQRLSAPTKHSYLRDFIYGAIDGTVTTFAVVCAVEGAGWSAKIAVTLGIANLIADGFSMGAGNFLGTRAERQLVNRARKREEHHIATIPEGEREEIRQIFEDKGFSGKDLDRAVEIITSDPEQWVDTMLREELGLALQGPSPLRAAITTFGAFVIVGLIPLIAYLLNVGSPEETSNAFTWSVILTGFAFFGVGTIKGRFVKQHWLIAGLETLGIGAIAAGMSYLLGMVISNISGLTL